MNQSKTVLEQISALADGQLQGEEFVAVVARVAEEEDLRATWQSYHLVGDVLRAGTHAPCSDSTMFLARFRQRVSQDPIVLAAPAQVWLAQPMPAQIQTQLPNRIEAANEPVFRWKLVAGAASIAAAAAIGWSWVGMNTAPAGPQLAQQQQQQPQPGQTAPVVAIANMAITSPANTTPVPSPSLTALSATRVMVGNGNPQVMLRDPRLDELLEAHRQAGGASQMPSGFLRNATFEAPSR
ncbi:MAG: sigma-E factor negative regulatory protein [Variovorax sp.]|nr:sigma-E factor negative regulatory protein [Variovorax sp.]